MEGRKKTNVHLQFILKKEKSVGREQKTGKQKREEEREGERERER
jgi:hypothetical protein